MSTEKGIGFWVPGKQDRRGRVSILNREVVINGGAYVPESAAEEEERERVGFRGGDGEGGVERLRLGGGGWVEEGGKRS